MRKPIIAGAALALSLAFAGTAQADTNVPALTGDWSVSNSSVNKVAEGVRFGTYADGGAAGGSLLYTGGNDLTLADVNNFSFTFSYNQAENWTGAVPYGRIWLDTTGDGVFTPGDNGDEAIMFDPSKGGYPDPDTGLLHPLAQGVDHSFGTSNQSVRFNDDAGAGTQQSWDAVKAAHGAEKVVMIGVTAGWTGSTNVSAMLKKLTFNGETFNFVKSPADGTNGKDGTNGTNGVNGKDGVTTIIREGVVAGASKRTLRVRKISGMKFISAKATLGGKKLTVKGRTIKVDLRGKSVGEYRVRITAKYQAGGKTYKVRSIRSLSIIRK